MNLWECEGKNVTVHFLDGGKMTGRVSCYTSALDNDPEPASITIGDIEILETEIERIDPAS